MILNRFNTLTAHISDAQWRSMRAFFLRCCGLHGLQRLAIIPTLYRVRKTRAEYDARLKVHTSDFLKCLLY